MIDYSTHIDAETWAFIERTNSFYPSDTVDFAIERQREVYDLMCRHFSAGYPEDVSAEDASVHADNPDRTIPIRTYRKSGSTSAVVLYFHGGGFVLGGLDSHDDVCAELCQRTGYEVVSVDYRLSPEHLFPASHRDAYAVFEWLAATSDQRIVLCGDSAGGNIAAAVAGAFRHHERAPVGQVLIYPGLGGDQTRGSYKTHANAPMLTARDLAFYHRIRTGGADLSNDVAFAPLRDSDFSDLPPTVAITAECDPLSSDGDIYCRRIRAAGGDAVWYEEKGLVHGYLRARHSVRRASESFSRIVEGVTALGRGVWPYGKSARKPGQETSEHI